MDSKYLLTAPLLLCFLSPACSHACAVLSSDSRASLAQEQTIIVWDAARHTEHFIRRLEFNTRASADSATGAGASSSVGFLVPTPKVPNMAEVSGQAFVRVQSWMKPREETRVENRYHYTLLRGQDKGDFESSAGVGAAPMTKGGVQVLAQQKVGAMQATVLKGGADEVVRWLKRNGYPSRPAFVRWLRPYARRGWVITAFKFARPTESLGLSTTTVRLSFAIDRPFYPYRQAEPEPGVRSWGHQLALYVFATGRIEGRAGKSAWKATPEWAQPVGSRPDLGALLSEMKIAPSALGNSKASPSWMTAFVDPEERPDADLEFQPASNQAPIEPPPIVHREVHDVYVPLDLAGVGLLFVGSAWLRKRREQKLKRIRQSVGEERPVAGALD